MVEEDEMCEIFKGEEDLEGKIHDTLSQHYDNWKEAGVLGFAFSVIPNGYV